MTYSFLVKEAMGKGELIALFEDWAPDGRPVHIAWPANRQVAPRVRLFSDWIREKFHDITQSRRSQG
ncbi:LysR substrate-binding domain-containing protein (plasmid) [Winslowiella sp. 2C04]|uniref:LysR substrate-binding domain-containing protein n=1 Tax=Winslowiella sp. 2C04 TaxID=3416179 RepID=UPI003CF76FB4